jgi:hypothetical protein
LEDEMADAKGEQVALRAAVLDAAEHWTTLNEVIGTLGLKGKVGEGKVKALVVELLSDGELDVLREDDDASPFRRARRNMVSARMRALGLATKDGATRESLRAEGVTRKDVDALIRANLIEEKSDDGERLALTLRADEEIWREGAAAFCHRTLPIAKVECEGLQGRILLALAENGAWTTLEDLQDLINKDGPEHTATGPLEEALLAAFNAGLVDLEGGEPKRWRESRKASTERRAAILEHLILGQGREATVDELTGLLGVPRPIVVADLDALTEAQFLSVGEDGTVTLDAEDGLVGVLGFAARHSIDGLVQTSAKEVAAWREKHATERRRADDLAQWLRRHGVEESVVLDQVRGIVRPPASKGDVFEHSIARPVDQAERGVILGEIIALENEIAQEELARDAAIGTHKSRIKALNASIQDLKNAAACNQRVVKVAAYRRTDWENRKVYVLAVDDDRVLAEEELPKGAQRTIPGTQAQAASSEPESETPAPPEAIQKFAAEIAEKGVKVSTKAKANGQTAVAVEPAAATDDEPGPLASDAVRKEHAEKPRRQRAKTKEKSAEASS